MELVLIHLINVTRTDNTCLIICKQTLIYPLKGTLITDTKKVALHISLSIALSKQSKVSIIFVILPTKIPLSCF